jgi:hypothetical protein
VLASEHRIADCSLLQVIVPADRAWPSSIGPGAAKVPGLKAITGAWPRIRRNVLVASARPGGAGRGATQLWLAMSHCTKFFGSECWSRGGWLTRLQETSPDADWNCVEKGLACELPAEPIVAAMIAAHIPAITPSLR